jgi:hypothetical protein
VNATVRSRKQYWKLALSHRRRSSPLSLKLTIPSLSECERSVPELSLIRRLNHSRAPGSPPAKPKPRCRLGTHPCRGGIFVYAVEGELVSSVNDASAAPRYHFSCSEGDACYATIVENADDGTLKFSLDEDSGLEPSTFSRCSASFSDGVAAVIRSGERCRRS